MQSCTPGDTIELIRNPSSTAKAKECVWLFISSLLVVPPVTCPPSASGQSQGHYAVIGHINRPFEIPILKFASECLTDRPHEEAVRLQYSAGSLCTVKLQNIWTSAFPFISPLKKLWSWKDSLFPLLNSIPYCVCSVLFLVYTNWDFYWNLSITKTDF